nr:PREDICTED: D-beta-hydroxybutyrate dehydrogenase, mitochondrial [Bemisia tabaci]
MKRKESLRNSNPANKKQDEVPWDLFDRCILPVIFSHGAAIILSFVLNVLRISQVSSFTLFILFLILSLGTTIFYHNLTVTAAGKAVLITGCETRMSSILAKQLDELGFTVFAAFSDLSGESQTLKDECSGRLKIIQLNPTSEKQLQEAYQFVKNNLPQNAPGLWALINNNCWAAFGEVEWVPLQVYERAADYNLFATIRSTQVFLPLLRKTQGRIINVSSLAGKVASPVRSPFCSMKFALEAFSECLRLELKKWGVDVVVIEPGQFTSGSWFEEKEVLQQAKKMWQEMSDDSKADYGEDYFEYKVRTLPEYRSNQETDLTPTVRSLVDSVTRTFPMARYTPVTKQEKLQAFVAEHLPRSVYDILYS